jgi:catechol 2,3-dioxygenase-like lactoylglutathione lyase family enzyme
MMGPQASLRTVGNGSFIERFMKLVPDAVRIFVSDIRSALTFYHSKLGLPLTDGGVDAGYLCFNPGNINILIEACDPNDDEGRGLVGRFVGLSFRVPNVEQAYEELKDLGVDFNGMPEQQPWGGTLAHLCDPDRNILTLVSF